MTAADPTHPAANLRDSLESTGWSADEFADRLGISRNMVSRLLDERCGISPDVALALERIGWSNAKYWMRRQAYYELALARLGMAETRQSLTFIVTLEPDEDGFIVASCPQLPGCHSQGRSRPEAIKNIGEAIQGYIASMKSHGEEIPKADWGLVKVDV